MPPNRNKPEKLDLPKAPKINQGDNRLRALPFSIQLQQMKVNAKNQVFESLFQMRKKLIKQIEEIQKSKVIVFYSYSL